jgi:hypothetical protein
VNALGPAIHEQYELLSQRMDYAVSLFNRSFIRHRFTIQTVQRGTSELDLFAELKQLIGFKGESQFALPRSGEIFQICLSGRKAREIAGWQPVECMKQVERTGQWR